MLVGGKLLIGPPQVRERAGKFSFQVAASGFWQIHPRVAETLLDAVMGGLKPRQGDLTLGFYYGSGLFATSPDHSGAEVFGVELDRGAAANARINVPRGYLLALSLAKALRRLPSGVDLVVLGPSRRGAGAAAVACVTDLTLRAAAYVVCDPASPTRDLAGFTVRGYETDRIRAFGLFPMTHHVECVTILKPATRT